MISYEDKSTNVVVAYGTYDAFSHYPPSLAATDITVNGGSGGVPVTVEAEAANLSVTLPTSLPVSVDADGVVTTADNAKILNNKPGPVKVIGVQINPLNNWELVDMDTDFGAVKAGTKQFGFQLQGVSQ